MGPQEPEQQQMIVDDGPSFPQMQDTIATTEQAPSSASVELGLDGISIEGAEWLVVFVILMIPALYFLKKKIDKKFS